MSEKASPRTKPKITLSLTTTSSTPTPTISLSSTTSPLTLILTITVQHHTYITAHSHQNILASVPLHGQGIEKYLDFIALTPLHDDILASDPLEKKSQYIEQNSRREENIDEANPLFLRWANYQDFHHLSPSRPTTNLLSLGPFPIPIVPIPTPPTNRTKDADGRWDFSFPSPPIIHPEQKFNWGVIPELEEGVEYEVRLKEGMQVKWWKEGSRDDHLELYAEHSNWVLAKLLGRVFQPWKGSPVLAEEEWIELEVVGEGVKVSVVA